MFREMRLLLQKNALTYVLPDFWLVSSLSLINIHLSWASRFPTEQFTSMKLTVLMSSYIPQQALNALSFLVYFLKTVLSSNRCYIHFNLVRKEFCSIFVLHRKSYHVGIRPVEHSNRSLASLYIPRIADIPTQLSGWLAARRLGTGALLFISAISLPQTRKQGIIWKIFIEYVFNVKHHVWVRGGNRYGNRFGTYFYGAQKPPT